MILTPTEFRGFAETALEDGPLQDLLDAAESDIVRFGGAPSSAVEWFGGGQSLLALARPAASITSITETDGSTVTTLAADDYLTNPGGYILTRIAGGTNSRSRWFGRVAITYVPEDDEARRRVVQVDLVKLALNYNPGLVQTTVGSWSEQYRQATESNMDEVRDILSRLKDGPSMVVIG